MWAKQTCTVTPLNNPSLSPDHPNPPIMPCSEAGNPSCLLLGWSASLLTSWRSGHTSFHIHVSSAFLLPGTCRRGAADSKQEQAGSRHIWMERRNNLSPASWFRKKNTHILFVEEKHRHLEGFQNFHTLFVLSFPAGAVTFSSFLVENS